MAANRHDCKRQHVSAIIFFFFNFIFFHFVVIIPIACYSPQFYKPVDQMFLDCGVSGNATQFGDTTRTWSGDVDSKFFPSQLGLNTKSVALTSDIQSSAIEKVPYLTARLSRSEFTYIFPATPGQKFIRLYFYPATYSNFKRHKAVFSVRAGKYTLLRDFNASVNADDSGEDGIYREFCMNLDEKDTTFNITFTPSTSEDSYAFVSGIEIVSMPDNLYYTTPEDQGLKFVGQNNQFFRIENYTTLENVYRQNIGGKFIPAVEDTGMYRIWNQMYNLYDYLEDDRPLNTSIKLNFSKIANYTAPEDVYTTAQTMGPNATLNKSYNLTWLYPVDSGFQYLIRLHFCEFEAPINNPGERVFLIYLRDFIAEDHADVIQWAGGKGIPIYGDYVVSVFDSNNEKKVNLSVKLQANPQDWKTAWSNVILNGVEIFKLNDTNGNLAGKNPDPPTKLNDPQSVGSAMANSKRKRMRPIMAIIIVGGVVFCMVIILIILGLSFLVHNRSKRYSDHWCSTDGSSSKFKSRTCRSSRSTLPSNLCRYFSLDEIKVATEDFNDAFIIGKGGFGNVYKGYIEDESTEVAIKRLKPNSKQGANEFKIEIEMLSQLRHINLVSLIGYCNDGNEMILVYDYMPRGTLQSHLYGFDESNKPPLQWKKRLHVCIGSAKGLQYLHNGAKQMIIHRDVKSTNILLDEKWVAKVSDFGLSKVGPTSKSKSHVTTIVKGSFGYFDPEYYRRQLLTEKSDVYSFGVVLCEVLCGRPAVIRTEDVKQNNLANFVRRCNNYDAMFQMIDPNIRDDIAPKCFKKFFEICVSCIQEEGSPRPSMDMVVTELELALQLQESYGGEAISGYENELIESDEEWLMKLNSMMGKSDDGKHVLQSKDLKSKTSSFTSIEGISRFVLTDIEELNAGR